MTNEIYIVMLLNVVICVKVQLVTKINGEQYRYILVGKERKSCIISKNPT